jgi:hypothetical protein
MEELEMPPFKDVAQIAQSAIEVGLAFMTGETQVPQADGLRLLEALQGDLATLEEAKTKKVSGRTHSAGDFLVVEDREKTGTWHLPVKVNGVPNRGLAGNAWAAVFNPRGFRGNVYEGPDKSGARRRLRALYKAEGWETPTAESAMEEFGRESMSSVFAPTALTFADMADADAASETAENVRHLSRRFQTLFTNIMFSDEVEDKMGAVRGLVDELAVLMGEGAAEVETDDTDAADDPLAEMHADGVAVEVARDATDEDLSEVEAAIESGRRAPVVVDFRILRPGPGNKKHNRYYPRDVLERDIHVFESVDVFATDHNHKERSEETKKGKVLQCPAYFMEDGSPIARTLIYDPDQAEKTRNRADAGALNTLECSIFGKGNAKAGTVDGKQYSIVEAMTRGIYLDLVSKGGAGGQAQSLVESENGGEAMNEEQTKTEPTLDEEVKEVDIQEGEAEQETDNAPQMLDEAAVEAALAETNLPKFASNLLRQLKYQTAEELQEKIAETTAFVKKTTGSGQVQDLGESEPPEAETLTVEEVQKRHEERLALVDREVGLKEVSQ